MYTTVYFLYWNFQKLNIFLKFTTMISFYQEANIYLIIIAEVMNKMQIV